MQPQQSAMNSRSSVKSNSAGGKQSLFRKQMSSTSVLMSYGSSLSIDRSVRMEDFVFDLLRDEENDKVDMNRFQQTIEETGIRLSDPRLCDTTSKITDFTKQAYKLRSCDDECPMDVFGMGRAEFTNLIEPNLSFISRILERELVIPNWEEFCAEIEAIFLQCRDVTEGSVATYIPQLARCDPGIWGLSLCTVDGQRFSLGNASANFTMQASQFPLAYAVALNHCQGEFSVHDFVGFEPSGLPYRSMALNKDNKPHNPLIGTGAMVVASLINPKTPLSDRFDFLISRYKEFAGGEYVGFNNAAFLSERSSSDRNVAIGHILRESKCFPADSSLADTLDFYFQMCSIETNCESGALMAGTLANGGVCPITSERLMSPQSVRSTLSLMSSTGMYDFSGQFAFQVGLPAKSAISGCLLLVVPGVCGFCLYAPALDKFSNPARAVRFCQELVNKFNFHNFEGHLKLASTDKIDPCVKPYEASAQEALTIFYAAYHNDVAALRRAFLRGYSMQLRDYDQRTALHIAASEGHLQTVKFLTDVCGLSPKEQDRWGFTPLIEAHRFNWPAVEAHLLKVLGEEEPKSPSVIGEETN